MTAAASAPATASPPPATESAPSAGESSSAPSVALGPEHRVAWKTNVVSLKAKNLVITADDRRFAPPAVVDLHSDAGDARYWTLEATWFEAGIEMRMNVYFAADDTDWWATEIRTYNGRDPADWIEYGGTFFKSPLGKPYTGDLDISSTDPTPGRLMIKGLVLKVDR
jgi:hypothetical protein